LKHGRWPAEDVIIDHKNDDPMDNQPDNLQELTHTENQKKRRGRVVYRSYGNGRYGPGMNIHRDKRDGRYYVTHQASRGHGSGDLKNVKIGLGGFATLAEAEARVASFLAERDFPDDRPTSRARLSDIRAVEGHASRKPGSTSMAVVGP
jgi:hypothetical protein